MRRDLEIVRCFGDGNRIVVFAPAERRDEARKLRPERCMLARQCTPPRITGPFPLIEKSVCGSKEIPIQHRFTPSDVLRQAFDQLRALGQALPADEAEMDRRLDEIRQAIVRPILFRSRLGSPSLRTMRFFLFPASGLAISCGRLSLVLSGSSYAAQPPDVKARPLAVQLRVATTQREL